MVQIEWTKQSLLDLRRIYNFIAAGSKRYAQFQIEKIQRAVENLGRFPAMGRKVPEFPELDYRELIIGNYRIIYKINKKDNVMIMSIIHVRQDLKNIPERN